MLAAPSGTVSLRQLSKDKAPSLATLHAPYPKGFGFPDSSYREIEAKGKDLESFYKNQLEKFISECRIFISSVDHAEVREAA
jgi:hypothetical protein